ncbi:MAG: cell division protein FtsZ [Hyphomicrobiaceae bacterium]
MSIKLQLPKLTDLRPRLTVIGVGGAGCNAINNMIAAGLTGVDFVVANTDAQALAASSAEHRVQLGVELTEGLGAGSKPEIGEAAAEEAIEDLRTQIVGSHMVFIASGMGGGTGTGAAAVIARVAKEMGILTVGIVTKPFFFEGTRRMRIADIGIAELKKYVDTLIVIPNQNLFRVANEKTTFAEAFVLADQVLYSGVACIVDLIIKEGLINLDFADVRTVMSGMGTAMMGTGEASGERRAILAAEEAIANPLLDDVSLRGARGLLLSISGGRDLTLYEVDEAASRVREEVDPDANIIVGATFDESLGDRVRVSIVASGMMRQEPNARSLSAAVPTPVAPPVQTPPPPQMARPVDSPRQAAPAPQLQPQPAPQQQRPAPPQVDVEEVQRRLTAALQSDSDEQFADARWSDRPAGQTPPPTPPAVPQREMWQAPGSVMIEEAPPVMFTPAPAVQRSQEHAPQQQFAPPELFAPELPTEVRRPPRRMPELEEFPAPVQREYRNRAVDADPAESVPGKRPGLFERLAGRTRRADDSQGSAHAQPPQLQQSRTNSQPPARPRPSASNGWVSTDSADRTDQRVEFPEFFSRDRKV